MNVLPHPLKSLEALTMPVTGDLRATKEDMEQMRSMMALMRENWNNLQRETDELKRTQNRLEKLDKERILRVIRELGIDTNNNKPFREGIVNILKKQMNTQAKIMSVYNDMC